LGDRQADTRAVAEAANVRESVELCLAPRPNALKPIYGSHSACRLCRTPRPSAARIVRLLSACEPTRGAPVCEAAGAALLTSARHQSDPVLADRRFAAGGPNLVTPPDLVDGSNGSDS